MTIPQDPTQTGNAPQCQTGPSPDCVVDTTPVAITACGDQQTDQCGSTQTGSAPILPVIPATTPVITVPTSTPAALQLPSTGSPSAPISGLAALLLIVGIVFARIGHLASAR